MSSAECASRTGLTIRALRLYERRGLICPRRTGKNWRLYGPKELERLSEIITLKSFGIPLAQIAELLAGKDANIGAVLDLQQASLLKMRDSADRGFALIEALKTKMAADGIPDVTYLVQLAREISMAQLTAKSVAWKRYEQARPRTEIKQNESQLKTYAGHYELNEHVINKIQYVEGGLTTQLTGQQPIDIFPEGKDQFFLRLVPAQLTFVRDANGDVTGLVHHQDGLEKTAKRISPAEAKSREDQLAARIRNKEAFAGSADIIKKVVAGTIADTIDWSSKHEEFRVIAEPQVPGIRKMLLALGGLKAITFEGVNSQGWDVYRVAFESGSVEWSFVVGQDDKIHGEWIRDLP